MRRGSLLIQSLCMCLLTLSAFAASPLLSRALAFLSRIDVCSSSLNFCKRAGAAARVRGQWGRGQQWVRERQRGCSG